MEFKQEMNLVSASGYCMPFEERDGDVNILQNFGDGHPSVDFKTRHYPLMAVADGVVSGVNFGNGDDGLCLTVRYGKWDVTYGRLSKVGVSPFQKVSAGDCVAVSTDILPVITRFDGDVMDPMEFITMLYANVKMWSQQNERQPEYAMTDMGVTTSFDDRQDEIERLMTRHYAGYLRDLGLGRYSVPERTGESLRNLFTQGHARGMFYETMPSMINPLGLGRRAKSLVAKAQELLIADFLNYLIEIRGMELSGFPEIKKNG
ncbi:MAG: M23 family metallopeptidase [Bacteroidales bacterium]|nr:M23 family metallopeptidase [Bacteroidales bacterium]